MPGSVWPCQLSEQRAPTADADASLWDAYGLNDTTASNQPKQTGTNHVWPTAARTLRFVQTTA